MSAEVRSILATLDLARAAEEEGLTLEKAKALFRRVARQPTGAQIYKTFADEVLAESNREVARGEAAEQARQRARGERT